MRYSRNVWGVGFRVEMSRWLARSTDVIECPRDRSERRGNTLKGFKDLYLRAKARIWPYMCHIRLKAGRERTWRHVFKAHRLVYHSTLGLIVIKKKKKNLATCP